MSCSHLSLTLKRFRLVQTRQVGSDFISKPRNRTRFFASMVILFFVLLFFDDQTLNVTLILNESH